LRDRIARLERAARQNSRRDAEAQAAAWFTHARVEALLEIIQVAFPDAFPVAVAFLRQQMAVHKPAGEHPDPDGYEIFRANYGTPAKHKIEGENSDEDREEGTSRKRRRLRKRVVADEMDVDTDVPVRDRSATWMSAPVVDFSDAGWPAGYQLGSSPLSDVEGVAGPSGLSAEEKEKEKMPEEMEVEAGDGATAAPDANPIKVEEVEENVNRVRYTIVEVPPSEPAQPVIENAPAEEETQLVATEADGEAVVPKPEPVEQPMPLANVELTATRMQELKIITRKNEAGKEEIEILDSDDEMPAEEKGKEKEPDAKDGDGNAPDS
jgi:hypothetical protein